MFLLLFGTIGRYVFHNLLNNPSKYASLFLMEVKTAEKEKKNYFFIFDADFIIILISYFYINNSYVF